MNKMMSSFKNHNTFVFDKLETEKKLIKEQIQDLYLNDERVLSLGFSGGKDSSATSVLTFEAIMEIPAHLRKKTIYVLYSDTLMEILPVQIHTYKVLENIKRFAKENELPIVVMHAKPELSETMWSLQLGKGMRPPSQDNRYCTSRLKTDVQKDMLYETFGTTDIKTISIVGSRKEESTDRAKRLTENTIKGHLKGHSIYTKSLVFAPIEDFDTNDVWQTLRGSKIGREVLEADSLFALYASTDGEGAECQTILGNAQKNGENPGCSQSGGRFGCWNCGLVHQKDKALVAMQKELPYIKYLIRYRNWSVSTRDGNWERYRDLYNHKHFTRLTYNLDNHRFGSTSPGGMNVKTRAIGLLRLLYAEKKVKESVDFTLISDEELEFIQHRWILEGDLNLTAVRIGEKYDRHVSVSDEDLKLIKFARAFYTTIDIWQARVSWWYNIYANEMFCMQFVKQFVEKHSYEKLEAVITKIKTTEDPTIIPEYLMDLQVKKQFYPSPSLGKMIYREWREDKISYVTQALNNDYEGTWSEEEALDEYDLFEDENLSMQDKYDVLDNWKTYQGYDSNENFAHSEYMRFGGNYQYIPYRKRKVADNDKPKTKKTKAKSMNVQTTFDFAS